MKIAHNDTLSPQLKPSAAKVNHSQKEESMNTKKTILYERLSHEDGRENESVSIENQKAYLEEYAVKNGFTNLVHMADDGYSGTRWDRPAFMKMMDEVDRGNGGVILIKDMSRLGRDHLRVGLILEQLREMGVRLIAVAESIDTDKGEDDFMPFRNIIAEWHARDTSRKIKAIFGARTAQGKRVTGACPYGYMHDPNDRQEWVIDPETAPIVKRIFQSIINGKGVTHIADELTTEGILTPNAYWKSTGARVSRGAHNDNPARWSASTVIVILIKEDYMGWKVLNKTAKESYKSKKRQNTPDNKLIFKDSHPAIIDEETWNVVQRLRGTKRRVYKLSGEPNPLTGVLFCADCGDKMYHKQGATGRTKPHNEYVCTSYRHYSKQCTIHYIRAEVMEKLILEAIRRTSQYARENEAEFMKRVREEADLQQEAAVKESRKKLTKSKRRREELSGLIKKLYEAYAADKIPEKHFTDLLTGYDTEQTTLDGEIEKMQIEIDRYNTDSVRADKFLELVKRHTEFTKFSAALLNEFIEKVIVHEADKSSGRREQKIDIYLNYIGKFELPEEEAPPEEIGYIRNSTKKLRRFMTPEELQRARDNDARRYAKIRAARIAKEEAAKAAILQGTVYEIKPDQSGESEEKKTA
jgi:DNA invertase Pin-like site-specific DNA recombinase